MSDLKYAIRQLIKAPGFTAVAVLTLALGIGANTAIFSVIHSVLLKPVPYPHSERIAVLWQSSADQPAISVCYPDFLDWQKESTSFEHLSLYRRDGFALTGFGEPELIQGAIVQSDYFKIVGLPTALGRTFNPDEDKVGGEAVAVISHDFWQKRFAGSRDVLNRVITLNGEAHTIIGVAAPEMQTPRNAVFWTPLGRRTADPGWASRGNHPGLYALALLKRGVTIEQAQAESSGIASRLEAAYPKTNTKIGVVIKPLLEVSVGSYRQGLYLLLGAVALILLIACANLANLLLARGTARAQEIAVRTAMGASRSRIIRQLLTEALVRAFIGGLAGILLSAWARDAIVALSPAGVSRFQQVSVNGSVLAFSFGIAVATGIIFGFWPAWRASQTNLRDAMQSGGRTGSEAPEGRRMRSLLVVTEVALTLVLLIGAGLLMKSFRRAQTASLGFDTQNLLTAQIQLPKNSYDKNPDKLAFQNRLLAEVRALPGVRTADIAAQPPLNTGWQTSFGIEGRPMAEGSEPSAEMNSISENYFVTLGVPLLRGRAFTTEDTASSQPVMIIDQGFADRYWPGEDPIGKRVLFRRHENERTAVEVVGLVPTLKVYGYQNEPKLVQAYVPHTNEPARFFHILVRTAGEPRALEKTLRAAMASIDPNLPVFDVRTMEERIDDTFGTARLYTYLLGIFSVLAVLLAAVGLYGVMSYSAARRTREIGIRMALGAQQRQVLSMMVSQGVKLVAIGLLAGFAVAIALTRVIGGFLYQVSAVDPFVYAGVAALLTTIALLACLVPARRAARVNPVSALRAD